MTFFRNIFRRKNANKKGIRVGQINDGGSMVGGLNDIDYGVTINNKNALTITAVFSAIRLRSENIASLPKRIVKKTEDGKVTAGNHPISKLIRKKPNSYTNAMNFWTAMNAGMDGWGNAFAIIERDAYGDPVALHQLQPSEVMIGMKNRKKYYQVTGSELNFDGIYSDDEMCHFMQLSLDGIVGLNPIVYNAISLGKGVAATKFGSEFYKRGGNIRGVLETDGSMENDEFESFMSHYKNSARNFETPLLEYGIKYKQIGISPIAAQLLGTETFSIQDIARIFNVPPHLLCEMSHATFSNIENQNIQFGMYSLRPSVKRFETECESKLLFDGESDLYDVEFGLNGLMRGDSTSRGQWYRESVTNGYMTRNEVRKLEGLPALPGLDKPLYPGNLFIVGEDNNGGKGNGEEDEGK